MGLRSCTTLSPDANVKDSYKTVKHPNCLTEAEIKHVYYSLENDEVVTPLQMNIKSEIKGEPNAYRACLETDLDFKLGSDSFNTKDTQDFQWSIRTNTLTFVTTPTDTMFQMCNDSCLYRRLANMTPLAETSPFLNTTVDTDDYLNKFEGIQPELNCSMQYDSGVDVTTTYIGKLQNETYTYNTKNVVKLNIVG